MEARSKGDAEVWRLVWRRGSRGTATPNTGSVLAGKHANFWLDPRLDLQGTSWSWNKSLNTPERGHALQLPALTCSDLSVHPLSEGVERCTH
jgi:hypothetical protein